MKPAAVALRPAAAAKRSPSLRGAAAFGLIAAVAAAVLALPALLDDFGLALAMSCLMYVALAASWAMFSGATGYISLGTAAFFGIGAYFSALTLESWPWPLAVAGGGLAAAALAALAGLAILHLRGTYFAMITFGAAEFLRLLVSELEKALTGTVGRALSEVPSDRVQYLTMALLALGAVGLALLVKRSALGMALAGIGTDEQRAQSLGVATRWVKVAGFALSAFVSGCVGAAMAVRFNYIDPPAVFNSFISLQTVLIVTVGGAASLGGTVLAAVAFTLLAEALRLQVPQAYLILLGSALIACVLFMPEGLAGLLRRQRGGTR
jgi:branched-chain amino acid transport system permease protein